MFKKILFANVIMSASIGAASANSITAPYIGASLGVNVNSTTHAAGGDAGVYRGIPAKVFAGYGGLLAQSFYLAGELTATLGNFEISNKNSMKTSYGFGLSVLPGFTMSDSTLVFGRIGYVRARFTNVNAMVNGGQLGLGMQTALTQSMDLRAEYDYTDYASTGAINSPRTDEYTLGLVYRFD